MITQIDRIKKITSERKKLENKINSLIFSFEKKHKGVILSSEHKGKINLISKIELF